MSNKFTYSHEMAGVTATVVVWTYGPDAQKYILLGQRRKDSDAYPGAWCLPGGYLNVGTETVIGAAQRELREEVNLDVTAGRFVPFFLDDEPGRDPRYKQVINHCYHILVDDEEELDNLGAGDDLEQIKFVHINKIPKLAFAHNLIVDEFKKTLL